MPRVEGPLIMFFVEATSEQKKIFDTDQAPTINCGLNLDHKKRVKILHIYSKIMGKDKSHNNVSHE